MVLSSFRSYLILQLLSAMILFATFFLFFAALIAVFLLVVVALDHLFQWSMVTLASIDRSLQSSLRDVGMLAMRASAVSQMGAGPKTRH